MYLFLSRRYNDIDHIVPIIYRMAKDGAKNITLLCLTPTLDIHNDFRLTFLKEKFHITIQHIYQAYTPTIFHKIVAWIACTPHSTDQVLVSRSLWDHIRSKARNLFIKYFSLKIYNFFGRRFLFTRAWADQLIQKMKPAVVIMDWQKPDKHTHILYAAKERKIPVVAVPHGIILMKNEDFILSKDKQTVRQTTNYGVTWKDYDYSIVNSNFYRNFVVKHGVPPEKIKVIGSTRYCREWCDVYKNILPPMHFEGNKNTGQRKIKIVFMDHSAAYRIRSDIVYDTIKRLVERKDVDLIIKPSPGSLGIAGHRPDQKVSSAKLLEIAKIGNDIPSVSLIQWADAVISVTSSICIEVLLHHKAFLYPKYFHENEMVFEDMGACWEVHNFAGLEKAVESIQKNPNHRPYRQEDVDSFLQATVYGGEKDRDVLGHYKDFILSKALN